MSVYYNGNEVSEIVYGTGDTGKLNFKAIGYSDSDIPQYMKDGLEYAKEIQEGWDSSRVNINDIFRDDCGLVYFPKVDTSNVTKMSGCFYGCSNLTTIPQLDTSNVVDMSSCFYGCSNLTTIPQLDTSKVTSLYYFLRDCTSLTTIPELNTGNATNMTCCFYGCSSLTTIPQLDTSKVTNMGSCFEGCSNLTSIPKLDISKLTSLSLCFKNCTSLTTIPELDTKNVTDMSNCFYGCSNLTFIPELDTSKVTNISDCFRNCSNLKRIEGLSIKSMGSITSASGFFFGNSSSANNARYILIKDIGTNSACTTLDTTYARVWGIDSDEIPDARQSLIDSLLTYSFDRRAAGYSDCTIKLYSTVKAVLSQEEIEAIQAKGYIIS